MIRLSIIIPVYNSAKYLFRCLESVFHQNVPTSEFEVIIINDGSTDNSEAIINDFASSHSNIKVYNQPNSGQSIARNRGVQFALGEYIHFIDSDDYIHPNIYFDLLKILDRLPAQMLIFDLEEVYNESHIISDNISFENIQVMNGIDYAKNNSLMPFGPCQYIIKRDFIITNHISFPEGVYFEDIVFGTKALLASQTVLKLSQRLYYYVQYNSISTTKNKDRKHLLKIAHDAIIASSNFSEILSGLSDKEQIKSIVWLKNHFALWGIVYSLKTGANYENMIKNISYLRNKKCYPISVKSLKGISIKTTAFLLNRSFLVYFLSFFPFFKKI